MSEVARHFKCDGVGCTKTTVRLNPLMSALGVSDNCAWITTTRFIHSGSKYFRYHFCSEDCERSFLIKLLKIKVAPDFSLEEGGGTYRTAPKKRRSPIFIQPVF